MSGEEQIECPLCLEVLDFDDKAFFPCTCGYQICRFCWHRIRTNENGLCPACRKQYPEDPADFKPISAEQISKIKSEKRQQHMQRKQKISENLKHLANVRVVQKNLVFVVGLSQRLAEPEVLKKAEYFGKFGKVHKVVINHTTSYAGSQGPSASAYVTYHRSEDALRAIEVVNNIVVDNRTLKASLGTTKYCSHFLKNQHCPKTDCMYLHELGDPKASFTKDEMQQGKHQEYEKELHDLMVASSEKSKERKQTASPSGGQPQSSSPSTQIESWPHIQNSESTEKLEIINAPSQITASSKTDSEHKDSNNIKTTGIATEQDVSLSNKVQDQISESSQSSSASPVQYNQTLDAWTTGSSQSSESSDTDSAGVKQTQEVHHMLNDIVRLNLTNGYTNGYVDTRNSMQSQKPPRFQTQETAPAPPHINQSAFPPGLTRNSEVLNFKQNPANQTLASLVNKSTNSNDSFFSSILEPVNPTPLENRESKPEWASRQSNANFVDLLPLPESSSSCNNSHELSFNLAEADDDLGFDPWNESKKGLADLMARETKGHWNDPRTATTGTTEHMMLSQNKCITAPLSRKTCGAPPPGFTPNHINNFNYYCPSKPSIHGMSDHMDRMMMGRTSLPTDRNSMHSTENIHNSNNSLHKTVQMPQLTEKLDKTKHLQEEFRAMLPNINISFGSLPSFPSPQIGMQRSTIPQQNDIYKDRMDIAHWNYKSIPTEENSPASTNNLSNSSLYDQHKMPVEYQTRYSSAPFAYKFNQPFPQPQPQQQPQMSWDNATFNQMPPGFAPHLVNKHLNEQSILNNLPGVL